LDRQNTHVDALVCVVGGVHDELTAQGQKLLSLIRGAPYITRQAVSNGVRIVRRVGARVGHRHGRPLGDQALSVGDTPLLDRNHVGGVPAWGNKV
jgi:hypothetical protein